MIPRPTYGDLFKPVDPNVRKQDAPRLTSQNGVLAEALRNRWMTSEEARVEFGVQRLAARVQDLEECGFTVEARWRGPVKEYRIRSDAA